MISYKLIKEFGDLKVTQQFADLLAANEKHQEFLLKTILHFKQQVVEGLKTETPYELMRAVCEAMDEYHAEIKQDPKNPVSCKKGCAFCCHYYVSISEVEAKAIWEYCNLNNIPIDLDHLQMQRGLNPNNHAKSEHSACVFLDQANTCKIYPFRPTACRKLEVTSDPKYCDVKAVGNHKVLHFINWRQEALSIALGNADARQGSMAEMLLKTKPVS